MLQIKYLQTMIDKAIFELEYDISIYGKTITDLGKKNLKLISSGKSYATNDSTGDSDDHNPTEASQSVGTVVATLFSTCYKYSNQQSNCCQGEEK